ncbi:DUF645 family protein [Vibrio cholerae]|nr:DUF645 family protein [Vibrio cholerae]MCR9379264.1 DUF645 family protein [Vibrio cholerae]MDT8797074.1 DUF645 family protein [Vibrio cholerae]MDT8830410.1 DUF645 family protein [Vibrio cholerae]WOQ95330.1 DUF645 family protein [Vibrio cholerae]
MAPILRGFTITQQSQFWQSTSQLLALDVCLCDAFA